jgi:hypothetical protein
MPQHLMPAASNDSANTQDARIENDSASFICFRAVELEILGQTTTESTQPSEFFTARTLFDL